MAANTLVVRDKNPPISNRVNLGGLSTESFLAILAVPLQDSYKGGFYKTVCIQLGKLQ